MDLSEEKRFHFKDGTSVKNLNELKEKIESISYDEFYNHVNETKNDFANWIRFVLRDGQLADQIEKVTSIVETVEIINDYLYPQGARTHLGAVDDLQSHIEHDVLNIDSFQQTPPADEEMEPTAEPEPAAPEAAMTPEPDVFRAPPDEPVIATEPAEEEPAPAQEAVAVPAATPTEPILEAELDEEQMDDGQTGMSQHFRRQGGEKEELHEFHHDVGRMIVKDFIIGLIIGLVVGFFLGKVFVLW